MGGGFFCVLSKCSGLLGIPFMCGDLSAFFYTHDRYVFYLYVVICVFLFVCPSLYDLVVWWNVKPEFSHSFYQL